MKNITKIKNLQILVDALEKKLTAVEVIVESMNKIVSIYEHTDL